MLRAFVLVSFGVFASFLAGCTPKAEIEPGTVNVPGPDAVAAQRSAFVNVRVIPMDREVVLDAQTVLVSAGRIEAVGPSTQVNVPPDAVVIDGSGRYLIPGLVDAHVHINSDDAPTYVSYGVTTVRNMWGYPTLRNLMDSIADGQTIGPTIYSYSSGLDAPPVYWPFTQLVNTPNEARAAVVEQLDAGWIGIKVYDDLSLSSYDAIIAAAAARGMPVVGHVPRQVNLGHALKSGQRSIEHLTGYARAFTGLGTYRAWAESFSDDTIRQWATSTANAGTWNCPTLAIQRPNAGHVNRARVVRFLKDAGAGLLAGSDAGIERTAPGQGLRDELLLLVSAGLSPFEALRAATADVARFLERSNEFGTIAPGARADLVLLYSNPLERIENVGQVAGVMLRGLWIPAE